MSEIETCTRGIIDLDLEQIVPLRSVTVSVGKQSIMWNAAACFMCATEKYKSLTRLFSRRDFSPFLVKRINIIHPHAKDEKVLLASLLSHLDVGSVHGTDGQAAIQHELHVASARGLSAGCGDLLGEVGCRDR